MLALPHNPAARILDLLHLVRGELTLLAGYRIAGYRALAGSGLCRLISI